jgi:4'-phosphopantetheinyl transferase
MNWEKSGNINEITSNDQLLIVYGTNLLADKLPITEILTSDEFEYSERLKGNGQKSTWRSCRATLRMILANYLKTNPQKIEFRKGRFGKLSVIDSHLSFNVSHTSHSFLMGFNPGGRIGVDIENLTGQENLPDLIDYAFSADEANYCKTGETANRFLEVWTLKEAFLKATGVGLVDELKAFSVIGLQENVIDRFGLNKKAVLCPNGETGSIVFRNNKPIKFVWLNFAFS